MIVIYVTVELCQGNIAEVCAYPNEQVADLAEQRWLKDHNIRSQIDRNAKEQNGIEFHIFNCTLEA